MIEIIQVSKKSPLLEFKGSYSELNIFDIVSFEVFNSPKIGQIFAFGCHGQILLCDSEGKLLKRMESIDSNALGVDYFHNLHYSKLIDRLVTEMYSHLAIVDYEEYDVFTSDCEGLMILCEDRIAVFVEEETDVIIFYDIISRKENGSLSIEEDLGLGEVSKFIKEEEFLPGFIVSAYWDVFIFLIIDLHKHQIVQIISSDNEMKFSFNYIKRFSIFVGNDSPTPEGIIPNLILSGDPIVRNDENIATSIGDKYDNFRWIYAFGSGFLVGFFRKFYSFMQEGCISFFYENSWKEVSSYSQEPLYTVKENGKDIFISYFHREKLYVMKIVNELVLRKCSLEEDENLEERVNFVKEMKQGVISRRNGGDLVFLLYVNNLRITFPKIFFQ